MNIAKSSLKLFGANIIGAAIQFVGITYFARELGAASVGVFFLFEALLGMLAIPADFGLRGALEKRVSEGESRGAFLSSTVALKVLPVSIILLGIFLGEPYINDYLGANVALLLGLAIVLQEVSQLSLAVLRGELRVGETAVLRVVRQGTWFLVSFLLINQGYGSSSLIYGLITGLVLMSLCGWFKCSVTPGRPTWEHARSLFRYGRFNFISSIGGYFYNWMDIAILGLFLTQAHVGAYEIAWRVSAIVMLLSRAIAKSAFPEVSRLDANDDQGRIEDIVRDTITPSMVLVIPSMVGAAILSRDILRLVFGPEFTIAWVVLIILMSEKLFQSVHIILGRALQGINRPDLAAYATVVSVVANLVLNVVLIYQFGLVGAAFATTLSFILNTTLHGYYLSKFIKVEFPIKELSWLSISAIGMGIALWFIWVYVSIDSLIELVSVIVICAVLYFVFAVMYKPFRKKMIDQIRLFAPVFD